MKKGTGAGVVSYSSLEDNYVQLFALVHPAGNVLAAGPGGSGALSIGMAGVAAIPDCRHSSGRSAGAGEGDYFSAGKGFARTRSRLTRNRARG